jgi:hypothetical protein
MDKKDQLKQFAKAYEDFVGVVVSLKPESFLASFGPWSPRDIVGHLIGWNYNIRRGCEQIRAGSAPSYHADGPNDYRTLNAEFIARYNSTDRGVLLAELGRGKDELASYVQALPDLDWDKDFGARHYRGGPATVARSIESLTRDYLDHAAEISIHTS